MIPESVRKNPQFLLMRDLDNVFTLAVMGGASPHLPDMRSKQQIVPGVQLFSLWGERINPKEWFWEAAIDELMLDRFLRFLLFLGGQHAKAVARVVAQISFARDHWRRRIPRMIDLRSARGYILGSSVDEKQAWVTLFEPEPEYLMDICDGTGQLKTGHDLNSGRVQPFLLRGGTKARFAGLLDHDTSLWLDRLRDLNDSHMERVLEGLTGLIKYVNEHHAAREEHDARD